MRNTPSLQSVLALVAHAHCACGWGNLGHRTVAYLAEEHLPQHVRTHLANLTGFDDFSDAAVWADIVVKEPFYSHTASWHYINVHDSPPNFCNVSLSRDSSSENIITALTKQTQVAITSEHYSKDQIEAFRFITHFVGDIHQPLHIEDLERGGGDIATLFEGEHTSLHIVWDVNMIEKLRKGRGDTEREAARIWAQELSARDNTMSMAPQCDQISNTTACLLSWARESNAYVCSHVLHGGLAKVKGKELSGSYYNDNIELVQRLIHTAGVRLADWILLVLEAREEARSRHSLEDAYLHVDL